MEVYKIDIESWTASFRYPNLISGVQPTLEVPPLSTVLGLINAAAGQYLKHKALKIGYYFEYQSEGEDLETIYQISSKDGKPTNNAKSNIIYRRFLFNNLLRIYTPDEAIKNYLAQPHYQLLLGRMNDLASVVNISDKASLQQNEHSSNIRGQIIPFKHHLPGQIQALPKYFTDEFPRKNLGTEPYSIIGCKPNKIETELTTYRDTLRNGKPIDIYFHELIFE
ncbi:MAG: type I-B CRISPR-associated protein Cas5 [Sphingobacteriales bacterium]|uniref:type I-B CRISPR-associated protein Cas5b n=1 Tax=uncultured Dysgonomonas sp. TaxID=206096 RepID=UPI000962FED6|nr:type I-B CRISPR-associated protein Cas5b [uncultured Dysgonomonas sp.]MBN8861559.1 type I-B CRISPR-associated protein Cas5 [Sphingobacteriales bacterium]OJY86463.1 MAG: type I-B CRISPR-associated protein Cas5 [Sphingobacteriales bacterium 44-15]